MLRFKWIFFFLFLCVCGVLFFDYPLDLVPAPFLDQSFFSQWTPLGLFRFSFLAFFLLPWSIAYFYGRHSSFRLVAFLSNAFLPLPLVLALLFLRRYYHGDDQLLWTPLFTIYRVWGAEQVLGWLEELLAVNNHILDLEQKTEWVKETLGHHLRHKAIKLDLLRKIKEDLPRHRP